MSDEAEVFVTVTDSDEAIKLLPEEIMVDERGTISPQWDKIKQRLPDVKGICAVRYPVDYDE